MIGCTLSVFNTVSLHKRFEFCRSQLWSVVGDNICSASPYAATSSRSLTAVDVVVFSKTSGHLEWASMMTKNEVPIKGPAKSRCSLCHGLAGHVHGSDGAHGGACLLCGQEVHPLAICSMSASTPGHQI